MIYRMLLTTPYCTSLDHGLFHLSPWDFFTPAYDGRAWKFHLHTAILSVNKHISAEAMRILYQGNDFIILKDTGMNLGFDAIPHFKPLAHSKISPVLRIEVAITGAKVTENSRYLVTAPEGLQSIIRALWFKLTDRIFPRQRQSLGDLSLTLDLNFKAASRYQVLSERIIKPWETISVKELILKGDIKESTRLMLDKSNLEGPFPHVVAAYLAEYDSLAEQAFEQGNYDAAQWWWAHLEEYWNYVSRLKPHHMGGQRICMIDDWLSDVLRKSYFTCHEGILKIVKGCVRELRYTEALVYSDDVCSRQNYDQWEYRQFGHKFTPNLRMKLDLCDCLAFTALGKIGDGMESFNETICDIVNYPSSLPLDTVLGLTDDELEEDLEQAVNNELIQTKSLQRCGRQVPLSPTEKTGPEWQVGVVKRSFWEWMELPKHTEAEA
jgi:hypothetical protein